MALFDFLKPGSRNKVFVTEAAYRQNTGLQLQMASQTLEQLRQLSVTPEKELRLEYFFYTNTAGKAAQLTALLAELKYSVRYGVSAGDKNQFVITGWTTAMKMDEETVGEWISKMCALGYRHDCEFDGWGTNPAQ